MSTEVLGLAFGDPYANFFREGHHQLLLDHRVFHLLYSFIIFQPFSCSVCEASDEFCRGLSSLELKTSEQFVVRLLLLIL